MSELLNLALAITWQVSARAREMIAATIKKREGLLRAQINEIHTRLQLLEMSGGATSTFRDLRLEQLCVETGL